MIGKVVVKTRTPDIIKFTNIGIGQGVIERNEVRLKIDSTSYLHFFGTDTSVEALKAMYWPENLSGQVRRFRLIAEEI